MSGEIVTKHVGDIEPKPSGLAHILEKAIYNPEIDIDRIIQLKKLYDETEAMEAAKAFNRDFAAMQPDLPIIDEKGDAGRWTFARWEDINEAIAPVLKKYGFAINFRQPTGDGVITTYCCLHHRDGHSLEGDAFVLPFDTSGSKSSNIVQAIGSSSSYGKRYTAMSMLNLQTTLREDDDGKKGGTKVISAEQLKFLLEKLDEHGEDIEVFCKRHAIEAVSHLPEVKFDLAIAELKLKVANKALKSIKDGGKDAEE